MAPTKKGEVPRTGLATVSLLVYFSCFANGWRIQHDVAERSFAPLIESNRETAKLTNFPQ